jgi:hypothetical protein
VWRAGIRAPDGFPAPPHSGRDSELGRRCSHVGTDVPTSDQGEAPGQAGEGDKEDEDPRPLAEIGLESGAEAQEP